MQDGAFEVAGMGVAAFASAVPADVLVARTFPLRFP